MVDFHLKLYPRMIDQERLSPCIKSDQITGVAEAQQENIHRGQPRSQGPLWFVGLRDASVTRRQISRIKLSRPTLADSKMAAQFYIQTRQVSIKLRFKLLFSISCESSDGNALENYFNL